MDVKKENNIYGVYLEKENVDQMTIGQRIKYSRKRKGYTQKEIGELLGFANTSAGTRIVQYETGIRVPKRNMLATMAQLFEVSPFALMPLDIDTTKGLMHTLFALEDRYGLTVAEEKGEDQSCVAGVEFRITCDIGTGFVCSKQSVCIRWNAVGERKRCNIEGDNF
ncbi:helix-turn-helix domain-containing protein [Jutongia huaianensis]|uniref:Helix-turn-helix transcriptional regulator n=1 Tax=Jutongia huaianensis TaxID=2763668 RepID=A0ABR7MY83_9FIRM|nr:helix-turn-helix transcriptional regulator [Jutongia huaianensis]MBC8561346.1 helix-turn-helix transcriptional regulator [Jutongia huaianensis]OKZ82860.1 MAG: hypothetical protein BHW06_09950 [Clostridium sp. 44_14]